MQNKRQKYEIFGKKNPEKKAKKVDFRKMLDPIWAFILKRVP